MLGRWLAALLLALAIVGCGAGPKHSRLGASFAPMVGQTLVASPGTWVGTPTRFTYQWQDCDGSGNNCTSISGATSSSYVVQSSDIGFTLRTGVTAWNNQGSAIQYTAATGVVTGSGPPVVAQRFVATTGTDTGTCSTLATACATFNYAYQQAAAGDLVEVENGTYSASFTNAASQSIQGQVINWSASHATGANVVFQPASGATVTINGMLRVMASHVEFHNMTVAQGSQGTGDIETHAYDPVGSNTGNSPSNIVFDKMTATSFQFGSTANVTFSNSTIGPESLCGSSQAGLTQYGGVENLMQQQSGAQNDNNIVFNGDTFRNLMSYNLTSCHICAICVFAGTNTTVENSKFYGNDVLDMEIQDQGAAVGAVTLVNNWFANTTSGAGSGSNNASVSFEAANTSDFANSLIAHNVFHAAFEPDTNALAPATGFKIVGNLGIMPFAGYCPAETGWTATFVYNIWTNSACGANDRNLNASLPLTNQADDATMNYDTTAGSAAFDFVPVASDTSLSSFTTDIHGNPRPDASESFTDAGANELP